MFELFKKKPKNSSFQTELINLSDYSQEIYNNIEIILDSIKNKRFHFSLDMTRSTYSFATNLNSRISNLDYRLKEIASSNVDIFKNLEEFKYKTFLVSDFLHDLIIFSPEEIEIDPFFYYVLDGCKDLIASTVVFLNNLLNYVNKITNNS